MKKWNHTIATMAGSVGLALACTLAVSTAQAQPSGPRYDQRDGRGPDGNGPPGQRRQWERDHDRRYDDRRHDDRRGPAYRPDRRPDAIYVPANRGRGLGPRQDWYRGGYVSAPYRGYSYVVNDWRGHRLSSPPRGYQWIQYGGDYLLIAIGSGLIANVVFSAY